MHRIKGANFLVDWCKVSFIRQCNVAYNLYMRTVRSQPRSSYLISGFLNSLRQHMKLMKWKRESGIERPYCGALWEVWWTTQIQAVSETCHMIWVARSWASTTFNADLAVNTSSEAALLGTARERWKRGQRRNPMRRFPHWCFTGIWRLSKLFQPTIQCPISQE